MMASGSLKIAGTHSGPIATVARARRVGAA